MNPLIAQALAAVIRHALTIGSGILVAQGIWTQAQAETMVAGAVVALIALGWSLWQKWTTTPKDQHPRRPR